MHPRDMSRTGRGGEAAATAPASPIPEAATAEAAGISSTDTVDGLKCFLTLQALLQSSGIGRQATGFPAFRRGCNRYHAGLSEEQYERKRPRAASPGSIGSREAARPLLSGQRLREGAASRRGA